jgi:hypothetical protein
MMKNVSILSVINVRTLRLVYRFFVADQCGLIFRPGLDGPYPPAHWPDDYVIVVELSENLVAQHLETVLTHQATHDDIAFTAYYDFS